MSEARPSRPNEEALIPFEGLGKYQWPSMPAEESARLFLDRVRRLFHTKPGKPVVAPDHLQRATLEVLDEVVAPPACGPLLRELELTIGDWVAHPSPRERKKLIILPPCDENGVVETWARQQVHEVIDPPTRSSLVSHLETPLPDLAGEGLLVIPRLHRWFLRQRNGLILVRRLLAALDAQPRPFVIGCNSWAWAFLVKTVGADLILPEGLTFHSFDAERLHRWFAELGGEESTEKITFRLSQNGKDVMEVDSEGALRSDYLKRLAAHSLGIPWVAWHLWRSSLRREREEGADTQEIVPDENTLWVSAVQNFTLPSDHRQTALLVLQALLIHGRLTAEELRHVLPLVGETFIVAGLITAGFVEKDGDEMRCRPAAYPSARTELFAAGFPMDRL